MKTIQVIEDDDILRSQLLTILGLEGFRGVGAENGRRGVELARAERPDLILCDIMMPDLDGHGVLLALRGSPQTAGIPFIFLTAKGERTDVRAGMNLGADDYLVKPVERKDLLAAIRARLQRQEQFTQLVNSLGPTFGDPQQLESLGLTPREAEVLFWVAQGKTNPEIALILGTTAYTPKKHLESIFDKLGVESRHAAMVRAIEHLSAKP